MPAASPCHKSATPLLTTLRRGVQWPLLHRDHRMRPALPQDYMFYGPNMYLLAPRVIYHAKYARVSPRHFPVFPDRTVRGPTTWS
jgi:hypothetical protein